MATKMWSVRHILHVRGYKNPKSDMIERDFISNFYIKQKIEELGSNAWDNFYYQKKLPTGTPWLS